MGKYVKLVSEGELQEMREKDPDLAKFLDERKPDRGTIGASLMVVLPPAVEKWLDENERNNIEKAQEAYSLMLSRCTEMLMGGLPSIVTKRMRPIEAIEALADEVVECVYALPFKEAGEPINEQYTKLADLTLVAGKLGTMLSAAMICAEAHRKLVKIAEGREDIPDIDPVLAAKATHREHATVN